MCNDMYSKYSIGGIKLKLFFASGLNLSRVVSQSTEKTAECDHIIYAVYTDRYIDRYRRLSENKIPSFHARDF